MWKSRNKTDLMIEVWEKLDCESVGAAELEAIETAVDARFGKAAVDSPMRIARLLADEGADLRHSEIMELHLRRRSGQPHEAALRNILDLKDLRAALNSIRNMENLRRKLESDGDRDGLRQLRSEALEGKKKAQAAAGRKKAAEIDRRTASEAAAWLTLWLQSPELFENWVKLRRASKDFTETFGRI